LDSFILSLAFGVAYLIRFDGMPPSGVRGTALIQIPYATLLQLLILSLAGLHKTSWRYVSLADVPRIAVGLGAATALLMALRFGLPDRFQIGRIPLGVIAADAMLAGVGLIAARILRRLQSEHWERKRFGAVRRIEAKRVLLIGAGRAGAMVARELVNRPDVGMTPVGFIDDDLGKIGTYIHGLKVFGGTQELHDVVEGHDVREAIITIANATGETIRRLFKLCEEVPVPVQIIPGIYEILDGRVSVTRMRKVQIEDLLGREPVELDKDGIAGFLRGKRVLVTGAGGSIGSELCRQMCGYGPAELVMLEQAENPLFAIDGELRGRWPEMRLVPIIADVCDTKRLEDVFGMCKPEVVFHAAAHKHVPMMELNPGEAIKNNSMGTAKVADAADRVGCEVMVMISTDKAVNPTSVMGATKRVAEIYVQAMARKSKTRFVAVRFGNVLGSAGSVIPIFEKQIASGGPVTVTHPDMRRYFMTIPEACQLVTQAASMAEGGEIFVLDMGEPVKIVDLARDMIRLSGFTEGRDIEIKFTGIRPGEKLYEELALDVEGVNKTLHPKIYIGKLEPYPWEQVMEIYDKLQHVTETREILAVRKRMAELLPEFQDAAKDDAVSLEEILSRTPAMGSDQQNPLRSEQ